jgi:hypothetical protein
MGFEGGVEIGNGDWLDLPRDSEVRLAKRERERVGLLRDVVMIASNCEAEDGNEKVEDGMGPLESPSAALRYSQL